VIGLNDPSDPIVVFSRLKQSSPSYFLHRFLFGIWVRSPSCHVQPEQNVSAIAGNCSWNVTWPDLWFWSKK